MKPARLSGPWPRLQRAWDVRAACNFIGGGTGTGLIVLAFASAATGADWLIPALAGLVFVGFGLLSVFLEIGRPWRALNVFLHPQTSWMTREGVLALPLFGCGAAAVAAHLAGLEAVALALLGLAAAAAAGFLYCQARILRAARGIPSWRSQALTPYILTTGPCEATGIFVALAPSEIAPAVALFALLVLRAALWLRYRRELGRGGAPEATLEVLDRLTPRLLLGGHAASALLLAAGVALPHWQALAITGGLLAAGFGWHAKLVLITKAAHTQGFAIPRTPVRGRGSSRAAQRPGWAVR